MCTIVCRPVVEHINARISKSSLFCSLPLCTTIVLRQKMPMLLLTSSLTKEEIPVMVLLPVVSKIARIIVRVALAQKRDVGDITGLTIVTVTSVFVTTAGYVSLQGTKVMKTNSLLMSLPTKSTPMIRVSMM